MSDAYDVSVTIKSVVSTKDANGDTTEAETTIGTATARQHFYSTTSLLEKEQGAGRETRELQLFVFDPPFPAILPNPQSKVRYRLSVAGGSDYNVLSVRTYEYTMQVDTEIIG
jgi:hypothetical protein